MGSILEITAAEYHADPCEEPSLTATIAKILVAQSPKHAWAAHPRLNPNYERKDDDRFDIGNCVHALLLEGVDVVEVVAYDDWRTAAAREARDTARQYGRIPLLAKQAGDVHRMYEAVTAKIPELQADPLPLTDGAPEKTIVWREDGVLCRARIDWLHDDLTTFDDVKTTSRSAEQQSWARTMYGSHFDVQLAFYRRAIRSLSGADADGRFLVCETADPFEISLITLDAAGWAYADDKVTYALRLWKRCLETSRWDGHDRRPYRASPPAWAEAQWLERDAEMQAA